MSGGLIYGGGCFCSDMPPMGVGNIVNQGRSRMGVVLLVHTLCLWVYTNLSYTSPNSAHMMPKYLPNDAQMLSKWCPHDFQMMPKWWYPNDAQMMSEWCVNYVQVISKWYPNIVKMIPKIFRWRPNDVKLLPTHIQNRCHNACSLAIIYIYIYIYIISFLEINWVIIFLVYYKKLNYL